MTTIIRLSAQSWLSAAAAGLLRAELPVTATLLALMLFMAACAPDEKGQPLRIGHPGSPLTASLYAAGAAAPPSVWTAVKFNSAADIGYALLSGDLDAGFVEPGKLAKLAALPGFKNLEIVGKVTFPYGAAVLVRKDLSLRLADLKGRKIAAIGPRCDLLKTFLADAASAGVTAETVEFKYLPPDAVLAALESQSVDAAVTKGSHAALGQTLGHHILYQKWISAPGDECCPPTVAQIEFVLLAQKKRHKEVARLVADLKAAETLPPNELRAAASRQLNLPANYWDHLPPGAFEEADQGLLSVLTRHGDDDHDQH